MASELAILGAPPAFATPLHVGRPNIGDRKHLMDRFNEILDRRWFSNYGPLVQEFERRIASYVGVKHAICVCNATVGLEIAIRAAGMKNEVIVPSYTFIATAHSLRWQEITPIFADISATCHTVDPEAVRRLISPRTTGIVATHVWGRPCQISALESIAQEHGLQLIFDAAHAFGCSYKGRNIGAFGTAEVFSFHATKFLNSFEGGAICTNNDSLAERIRLMTNFGFSGFDNVVYIGTNGKMTEVCAAMGLTSLDAIDSVVEVNRLNYLAYKSALRHCTGLTLIEYDATQRNNYQYIVVEVAGDLPLTRDELVHVLQAENILARKYFWPGCHRMEPYKSENLESRLPNTIEVAGRVIVLPTGQSVDEHSIIRIVAAIDVALKNASAVKLALSRGRNTQRIGL